MNRIHRQIEKIVSLSQKIKFFESDAEAEKWVKFSFPLAEITGRTVWAPRRGVAWLFSRSDKDIRQYAVRTQSPRRVLNAPGWTGHGPGR